MAAAAASAATRARPSPSTARSRPGHTSSSCPPTIRSSERVCRLRAVDPPPAAGSLVAHADDVAPGIYAFYCSAFRSLEPRRRSRSSRWLSACDGRSRRRSASAHPADHASNGERSSPQDVVDDDFVHARTAAASEWSKHGERRGGRSAAAGRCAIEAQLQSLDWLRASRRPNRCALEYERHPNMVRLLTGQRRNLERATSENGTRSSRAARSPSATTWSRPASSRLPSLSVPGDGPRMTRARSRRCRSCRRARPASRSAGRRSRGACTTATHLSHRSR